MKKQEKPDQVTAEAAYQPDREGVLDNSFSSRALLLRLNSPHTLLRKNGSALRFFLCVLEECSGFFYNDTAQCEQRDHVRDSHQTVEDISDGPDSAHRHVRRPDKDSQNVDPPKDLNVSYAAA